MQEHRSWLLQHPVQATDCWRKEGIGLWSAVLVAVGSNSYQLSLIVLIMDTTYPFRASSTQLITNTTYFIHST